jgi:hypothetical protein
LSCSYRTSYFGQCIRIAAQNSKRDLFLISNRNFPADFFREIFECCKVTQTINQLRICVSPNEFVFSISTYVCYQTNETCVSYSDASRKIGLLLLTSNCKLTSRSFGFNEEFKDELRNSRRVNGLILKAMRPRNSFES